jgi:hypothetical protein
VCAIRIISKAQSEALGFSSGKIRGRRFVAVGTVLSERFLKPSISSSNVQKITLSKIGVLGSYISLRVNFQHRLS